MFETGLEELSDRDLLAAAAEYAQDQEHAAVGILRAALAFADRNAVLEDHEPLPGCERLVVYGGEGCPGVAEFAPVEFGAVIGISSGAAAALIGEALALRHRLPRVWAAVLSGHAVSWRARKIAHACLTLSLDAAAIVDRRVAGIVNTLTPGRLRSIVTAAVWEADPDQARAAAEAAAKSRGVFVAQSDEHGTKRILIRAASGAAIRFDATIEDLAWALAVLGDTDPLDQRRAEAVDWIADPAAAQQLLNTARDLAHTQTTPTPTDRSDTADTADTPGTAMSSDASPVAEEFRQEASGATPDGVEETGRDRVGYRAAEGSGGNWGGGRWDDGCGDGWEGRGGMAGPKCHDAPTRSRDAARDPRAGDIAATPPADRNHRPASHSASHSATDCATDCADDLVDDLANDPSGEPFDGGVSTPVDGVVGSDADGDADRDARFTRRVLAGTLQARLAAIKRDAYRHGLGAGSDGRSRRNRHTLYVHLTDKTLATGNGVLRVEELGPMLASQLTELLGHDQVVVKPVIDLHDQVSVHSYEIPDRIRERVRLRHPVDMFPYGTAEATVSMDQDHITPYKHSKIGPPGRTGSRDRTGPPEPSGRPGRTGPPGKPGQTSVDNLIPHSRLHHRAKTFGGWRNRRLPSGGIEWISPHGFRFIVDHTGTHPISPAPGP